MNKVLAVVPARGGSKSIPHKNIKPLIGKPLIEYTIETALSVTNIDKIVVSTDNDEIINVCKKYNNILIFRRPDRLATDTSPTVLTILHVLKKLETEYNLYPDVVLTLEPTSPLRSRNTIENCISLFVNSQVQSVMGVSELSHYPGLIIKGRYNFLLEDKKRRRQDRDPVFIENGVIYGTRTSYLKSKKRVIEDSPSPLIIPKNESIDINEAFDFALAESLMDLKNKFLVKKEKN